MQQLMEKQTLLGDQIQDILALAQHKRKVFNMGYFSNFAIDEDICHHDVCITSPEQQLLWRLDDLRDRLDELKISGALYGGMCCYTESELRYAPTGYFNTLYDVETAIELAVEDLRNKYGIEVSKDTSLQEIVIFSPYCVLSNICNSR